MREMPIGGEGGEVGEAADVVDGDAVDEDLGEVGVTAAQEERGFGAGLAFRCDLDAGDEAERLLDLEGVGEIAVGGEDGDRGSGLRERGGGAGFGDGDLVGAGGCGEG